MIVRDPWFPEIDNDLQATMQAESLKLIGIADATDAPVEEEQYREWIKRGYHGSLDWMERHGSLKFRPGELLPGCRSIIFVGLNYFQKPPSPPGVAAAPEPAGRIARYAWGRDYHKELGKRIKRSAKVLESSYPGERFRAWTDATPLAERHYGEQAGIGFTGRHTLLINGQYGSWFVIGEILSTVAFSATGPAAGRHGACPGNCTRCIDVCPTGALLGPHRIDAGRCISYLTIEYDGIIPEDLRPRMGNWIFGCDLCQEVCPLNVRAQTTDVAGFLNPIAGDKQTLREILRIRNDEEFTAIFAGSPVMRARRRRLVRNATIAAANLNARELIQELKICADDEDEVIAIHARWALAKIEKLEIEKLEKLE